MTSQLDPPFPRGQVGVVSGGGIGRKNKRKVSAVPLASASALSAPVHAKALATTLTHRPVPLDSPSHAQGSDAMAEPKRARAELTPQQQRACSSLLSVCVQCPVHKHSSALVCVFRQARWIVATDEIWGHAESRKTITTRLVNVFLKINALVIFALCGLLMSCILWTFVGIALYRFDM